MDASPVITRRLMPIALGLATLVLATLLTGGHSAAAPSAKSGLCPLTEVTLRIARPNDTTDLSTFAGAAVTVRNSKGATAFAGFNPTEGRVNVGLLRSGESYSAEIGTVVQPVPFDAGGEFAEMRTFTDEFRLPCEQDDGTANTLDVKLGKGAVQGLMVKNCTAQPIADAGRMADKTVSLRRSGETLDDTKTDEEGYFRFGKRASEFVYSLRFQVVGENQNVGGLLAAAQFTSVGLDGAAQFLIVAKDGSLCDIEPDGPGAGIFGEIP